MRSITDMITLSVQRNISGANRNMVQASQRLASGFRINAAADDPAGMSRVQGMRAQLRSIGQANRNAHDAISLIQTAEGGISSVVNMIRRMRELIR